MDDILELAGRLGKRLAADPRGARMVAAQHALEKSRANRELLADYERHQHKLMELESRGKPIEPEDKRRLADLHVKVTGSDVIKNLMKAQADFLELFSAVTHRMEAEVLGSATPDAPPAVSTNPVK